MLVTLDTSHFERSRLNTEHPENTVSIIQIIEIQRKQESLKKCERIRVKIIIHENKKKKKQKRTRIEIDFYLLSSILVALKTSQLDKSELNDFWL